MKPILMFIMESCPHCRRAFSLMEELKQENPEYEQVEIAIIDENVQPELAGTYDYYFVPTFFVGNAKVHEGVPSKDAIRNVYAKACE